MKIFTLTLIQLLLNYKNRIYAKDLDDRTLHITFRKTEIVKYAQKNILK